MARQPNANGGQQNYWTCYRMQVQGERDMAEQSTHGSMGLGTGCKGEVVLITVFN
jgi:hypothetical protein